MKNYTIKRTKQVTEMLDRPIANNGNITTFQKLLDSGNYKKIIHHKNEYLLEHKDGLHFTPILATIAKRLNFKTKRHYTPPADPNINDIFKLK